MLANADVQMSNPTMFSKDSGDKIITRALFRAAEILAVEGSLLAKILQINSTKLQQMKDGKLLLIQETKEFDRAVMFLQLFRSLDAIVGGNEQVAKNWLRNYNLYFADKPINKIQNEAGLNDVIAFLDASRAPI